MTKETNEVMDRILDLLIEKHLHGLDDEARLQLDVLLAGVDEEQRALLDARVGAALAAAGNASALSQDVGGEPPPASLLTRLEEDADRFFGTAVTPLEAGGGTVTDLSSRRAVREPAEAPGDVGVDRSMPPPGRARHWGAWSGWAVAALLLITLWVGRVGPAQGPSPVPPTVAESRAALIAEAGTLQLEWAPSAWADFENVRGDVAWNDERQEGYLRLTGMPANDPLLSQYQLWIVDPGRDEEPVDGGVFDIPAGATEVVIPIAAKLAVSRPAAFAITQERPGGVVVSEGPLLVVASRG